MKNTYLFLLLLATFGLESCLTGSVSGGGSNKTTTEPTGASSGSITTFVIKAQHMYTLDHKVLLTHDLTDPDQPELVHTLTLDFGLETIFLYDDHVYVGSTTSLYIINLSNPSQPRFVSKTERSEKFVNGCDPVIVEENYAYSTVKVIVNRCGRKSSRSALLVFDITDKKHPKEVAHQFMQEPNGLAIKDDHLFVCDKVKNSVTVFNVSEPNRPLLRDHLSLSVTNAYDIIIKDNRMIVSSTDGFQIFDVTNIHDIYQIGTIKA